MRKEVSGQARNDNGEEDGAGACGQLGNHGGKAGPETQQHAEDNEGGDDMVIDESVFIDNHASNYAGAIYNTAVNMQIKNSKFINNSA